MTGRDILNWIILLVLGAVGYTLYLLWLKVKKKFGKWL